MPPHRVQRTPRTRKEPVHKTSRRELHPIQRAFLCGALLGGASQQSLSRDHNISQATISRTFTRMKARAAELGIEDLTISDSRLIKEAPKLFEDQNKRGRKELLTPEQRAMVVAVATKSKEAMKAKSSKYVGTRKLEDGSIERTMDPELVALGLPQMSTSTFEGCMYEAGYVRTKEGWKKVGGGRKDKPEAMSNAQTEDAEERMHDQLESGDMNEDSMQESGEYSEANIHPDLQHEAHQIHSDLHVHAGNQLHHDPRLHDDHTQLNSGLPGAHHGSISHAHSHHNGIHIDELRQNQLRQDQAQQEQLHQELRQEQLRQEQQLREQLQLPHAQAPPYPGSDAWRVVTEAGNGLSFGV